MLVAKELPLGLSQNEVNDGLDEFPAFPIHHLPGIVLSARLFGDDKGSDQVAICTKCCSYSAGPNLGLFTVVCFVLLLLLGFFLSSKKPLL